MDKKIAQILYFVGILSKIEPTEKTFYLDMLKGSKITTPASTIIYDAYVSKYVRAQLIGNDDKTKGNYAGREGYNKFRVTPGKIREYYQLTADDAVGILSKGDAVGKNPGIIKNYGTFNINGNTNNSKYLYINLSCNF